MLKRLIRVVAAVALPVALCACGRVGTEGQDQDGRAIHVERGPQGTEIEFNPGVARKNADQAGRDLARSADQAGQALQRGAREAGEKLGPAARELGKQLQQGAQKVGAELGPAARQAGDALARGARQVGDQVGPAVRRAAADAALSAKVKAKLIADPEVKAEKIDVSTVDGVVTLSGRVETTAEHAAALRVAKETDGVHRLVDALQVGPG